MTAEHPIEMSDSSFLEWARGQLCGDLKSLKYARRLMDRRIDAVMQRCPHSSLLPDLGRFTRGCQAV